MTRKSRSVTKPHIEEIAAMRVAGRSQRYSSATRAGIPAQWAAVLQELGPRMYGLETFGVCHGQQDDEFGYLVGYVANAVSEDEGLDVVTLPAGRYAVFEHEGHITTISDTWAAIFDTGLAAAGLKPGNGPEFERYGAEFRPDRPDGVSIWIPLES